MLFIKTWLATRVEHGTTARPAGSPASLVWLVGGWPVCLPLAGLSAAKLLLLMLDVVIILLQDGGVWSQLVKTLFLQIENVIQNMINIVKRKPLTF